MSRVIDSFRRVQNNNRSYYDEPTYLGFKMMFHFNTTPLLNISEQEYTAYKFLKDNGYDDKAIMLENMVEELKYVSQNNQYYFQSIEGLDKIWGFDFYQRMMTIKEDFITVGTLEALDLRITKILDYYFQACYSAKKRTEIVPKNLRYFDISIYIKDWRFHNSSFVDFSNEDNSASLFLKLIKCEFKPFTFSNIVSTLSNTDKEFKTNKMEIICWGGIETYSSYVLSSELGDLSTQVQTLETFKPQQLLYEEERLKPLDLSGNTLDKSLGDIIRDRTVDYSNKQLSNISNQLQQAANRTGEQLVSDLVSEAKNNFTQAVLGNVYNNVSGRTLGNILNSQLSII